MPNFSSLPRQLLAYLSAFTMVFTSIAPGYAHAFQNLHIQDQDYKHASHLPNDKPSPVKNTSKQSLGSHEIKAIPNNIEVGISTKSRSKTSAKQHFSFTLKPEDIDSSSTAWLMYELEGYQTHASIIRRINDQLAYGGKLLQPASGWHQQKEAISINALKSGSNKLYFSALPQQSYRVKNLRVILQNEQNGIKTVAIQTSGDLNEAKILNLVDKNLETGIDSDELARKGFLNRIAFWNSTKASPRIELIWQGEQVSRGIQAPVIGNTDELPAGTAAFELAGSNHLRSINVYLSQATSANVSIDTHSSNNWHTQNLGQRNLHKGWNSFDINRHQVDAFKLEFTDISKDIKINEVKAIGETQSKNNPELVITYPDNGEQTEKSGYIKGFVKLDADILQKATLTINDKLVSIGADGSFESLIKRPKRLGDWQARIKVKSEDQLLLADSVSFISNQSITQNGYSRQAIANTEQGKTSDFYLLSEQDNKVNYQGVKIQINKGGLIAKEQPIELTPMRDIDMSPLDTGLINVTGGKWAGYRMLPHGQHFSADKPAEISIPYDLNKLPKGSQPEDIHSYYFDEQLGRWRQLERIKIDKSNRLIVSATTHFTDFINGIIKTPDAPQTQAFEPTQMLGIKAANPGAKINLIEVPKANSRGTANLGYPIEVPPGRQGMQPQLSVSYNSEGGNDWLGLGWNVQTPAISLDTRWGVPRYDQNKETEIYMLQGQQLLPENAQLPNRKADQNRVTDQVFHPRVEGGFERVIRKGSSPDNYWWEVTNKQGTRYCYGATCDGNIEETSVLRVLDGDKQDAIGHWNLVEVIDRHGNSMRYSYQKIDDDGIGANPNDGVMGQQTYPEKITYTNYENQDGAYSVTFKLQDVRRDDIQIDGRLGLKRVNSKLLDTISIQFEGSQLRSYAFKYTKGAFDKTLLKTITQKDANGQDFHTHTFEYYDDVRDQQGQYTPYENDSNWDPIGNPNLSTKFLLPLSQIDFNNTGTVIGSSKGDSWTRGVVVSVGPNDNNFMCKSNTAGRSRSWGDNHNEGLSALIDLDGDGLADRIYRNDHGVFYQKNISIQGQSEKYAPAQKIKGISKISKSDSHHNTDGYSAVIGACSIGSVNAGKSHTGSSGEESVYFSDVNGDGYIDLVDNRTVYFNTPNDQGVPEFITDVAQTANPIDPGATQQVISPAVIQAQQTAFEQANPLHDTVRVWVAPYAGAVRISGAVKLEKQTEKETDGVRVAIQHKGDELWSARLKDNTGHNPVLNRMVSKGDRIYFRVQSILNGLNDGVYWRPAIEYASKSSIAQDANGLSLVKYDSEQDYLLAALPGQTMGLPLQGTIKIESKLNKAATSDHIRVQILKNGQPIYETQYNAAQILTNQVIEQELDVEFQDKLAFRIISDTPIDWKAISWPIKMYYTQASSDRVKVKDQNGNYLIDFFPLYEPSLYAQTLQFAYPFSDKFWPDKNADPSIKPEPIVVTPNIQWKEPLSEAIKGQVTVSLKMNGRLLGKATRDVSQFHNLSLPKIQFKTNVFKDDQLWVDYTFSDVKTAARTQLKYDDNGDGDDRAIRVLTLVKKEKDLNDTGKFAVSGIHTHAYSSLGLLYRQWGQFVYKGQGDRAAQPIDESLIKIDIDVDKYSKGDLKNQSFDPKTQNFISMVGDGRKKLWLGYDDRTFLSSTQISSSRLGEDEYKGPTHGNKPARGVIKLNTSSGNTISGGGSFKSVSATLNKSDPENVTHREFMDLNGDRYPDIVNTNDIQFTDMDGRIEANSTKVNTGAPSKVQTKSQGLSSGLSSAVAEKIINGDSDFVKVNETEPSISLNGGIGSSDEDSEERYQDINGDGLPDKIYSNGTVRFNLGYRFANPESWSFNKLNQQDTLNFSANFGFNVGVGSIGGGGALSKSTASSENSLIDVNGDGLPDMFDKGRVRFNLGGSFSNSVAWPGLGKVQESESASEGSSVAFTVCIPFPPPAPVIKICTNPSASSSKSLSRTNRSVQDINGDGYPDILQSRDSNELKAKLSRIKRTNLLRQVKRPMGGSFSLDYDRRGNSKKLPQNHWVMSRVVIDDGHADDDLQDGPDKLVMRYDYQNGYYDRREREFYGFGKVIDYSLDAVKANDASIKMGNKTVMDHPIYRINTTEYHNQDYFLKGLVKSSRLTDAAGHPYKQSQNDYSLKTTSGNKFELASHTALELEGKSLFPALIKTEQRLYEGDSSQHKDTHMTFKYDKWGNVIEYKDVGELSESSDDYTTSIEYHKIASNHILSVPKSMRVQGDGVQRIRETQVNNVGDIVRIDQFFEEGRTQHDMEYDEKGNLVRITRPENSTGQRFQLNFTYDSKLSTYVTEVRDSFGYKSSTKYDLRWGTPKQQTDINKQVISTEFDAKGRPISITGPYEQGTGLKTMIFNYHPNVATPNAITSHYDVEHPGDMMQTVVFVDGLNRVIQTKKDASIDNQGTGQSWAGMTVSGRLIYDGLGRVIKSYYPVDETAGSAERLNTQTDTVSPTQSQYDILDRVVVQTLPDNTELKTNYALASDKSGQLRFEKRSTDANGIQTTQYKDIRQRITQMVEDSSGDAITTLYQYDSLNQLTKVTDDQGNITTVKYDNLGRRIGIDNPDTGLVEYKYDLASNLIEKITPELRHQVQPGIKYAYNYERLEAIRYPLNTENNVQYIYGAPGAKDNRANRIAVVNDSTGYEKRYYGKQGELIRSVREIELKEMSEQIRGRTYTTRYEYDSWNRLQKLTYPDGEVVDYSYDLGGKLTAMTGTKGKGFVYNYLTNIGYDKFEQRTLLRYGNGTQTRYAYEPERRRLQSVKSENDRYRFMDVAYQYDNMSNITRMTDSANTNSNVGSLALIGQVEQNFNYDSLYRLTSAKGRYVTKSHTEEYNQTYRYDRIHNITHKQQSHTRNGNIDIAKTSYKWDYSYQAQDQVSDRLKPHAVSKVGQRNINYDYNGNQASWKSLKKDEKDSKSTLRKFKWDEENRLMQLQDGQETARYFYNDGTDRIAKIDQQGDVAYINSYFVVRNGNRASKHFFAGSDRITTKVVAHEGNFPDLSAGDLITPPSDKICVYDQVDYKGERKCFSQSQVNLSDWGDRISSISVPKGYQVVVFVDNGYGGHSVTLDSSIRDLGSIKLDDVISSLLLGKDKPNASDKICFYEATQYVSGTPACFTAQQLNTQGKDLRRRLAKHKGSLSIPLGYYVTLYQDSDYNGEQPVITVQGGIPDASVLPLKQFGSAKVWKTSESSVCAYEKTNFSGNRICYQNSQLQSKNAGVDAWWQKRVQSIQMVADKPTLYTLSSGIGKTNNAQGERLVIQNSVNDLKLYAANWDGSIKHISAQDLSNSPICFYTQKAYQGDAYCYGANTEEAINNQGVSSFYNMNQRFSSVKVAQGYRITLFSKPNQQGTWHVLKNSVLDLQDIGFDNRTSSFAIIERPAQPISVNLYPLKNFGKKPSKSGSWYRIQQNGGQLQLQPQGETDPTASVRFSLFANAYAATSTSVAANANGNYIFNNVSELVINSLVTSGNALVELYEKPNLQGAVDTLIGDQANLDNIKLAGKVGSIRIKPIKHPERLSCFYTQANQSGQKFCIDGDVKEFSQLAKNNRITSMNIAAEFKIVGYEDPGFKGRSKEYRGAVSFVNGTGQDFNNQISSIKLLAEPVPTNQVCFFNEFNLMGERHCYDTAVAQLGAQGRAFSSISIPAGYRVRVFSEENYRGDTANYLSGNVSDLRIDALNNRIESIEVSRIEEDKNLCLYTQANYRGERYCFDTSQNNLAFTRSGNLDNRARSLTMPSRSLAVLHADAFFKGNHSRIRSDVHDLSEFKLVGKVSSFKLNSEQPETDKLCLYDLANYNGQRTCLSKDRLANLGNNLNNRISSFKLPKGYQVTLFSETDFKGESKRYLASQTRLPAIIDNKTSALIFAPYVPETLAKACFYKQAGYEGGELCINLGPKGGVRADTLALLKAHQGSVKVSSDFNLTLYSAAGLNQSQEHFTLINSQSDLSTLLKTNQIGSLRLTPKAHQQVCMYEEINYKGKALCEVIESYRQQSLKNHWWNKRISSVQLPHGYQWQVSQQSDVQAPALRLQHSEPDLTRHSYNNRISAWTASANTADDICFYQQKDAQGDAWCYQGIGADDQNGQASFGYYNNRFQSVRIKAGLRVALFKETRHQGDWLWLDTGTYNLDEQDNRNGGWANEVESFALLNRQVADEDNALRFTDRAGFDMRHRDGRIRELDEKTLRLDLTETDTGKEHSRVYKADDNGLIVIKLADINFDDQLQSINSLPDWILNLHENADLKGSSSTVLGNLNNISELGLNGISAISLRRIKQADALSCVYKEQNQTGARLCTDRSLANLAETGFDNDISAINVAPNYHLQAYDSANYSGHNFNYRGNVGYIDDQNQQLNDRVSSLRLNQEAIADNQVCFYDALKLSGQRQCYSSSQAQLGKYANHYRSLSVPKGYRLRLFNGSDYTGSPTVELSAGNYEDLRDYQLSQRVESFSLEPESELSICAYAQTDYQGQRQCYKQDQINLGSLNQKVSALSVANGREITLYAKPNYLGQALTLRGDANDLSKLAFNNKAQSARLSALKRPEQQVCFYEFTNYNGQQSCFAAGQIPSLEQLKNNRFSSVYIPKGLKVTLYPKGQYQGKAVNLSKSVADLSKNDLANQISSLVVNPKQPAQPNQLCFYQQANYQGNRQCYRLDHNGGSWPEQAQKLADYQGSVFIPEGYLLSVHSREQLDKQYPFVSFEHSQANLKHHMPESQSVQSFRVERADNLFCAYQNPYQNTNTPDHKVKLCYGVDSYRQQDLSGSWWDQRIRSVKVPQGYQAKLFDNSNFNSSYLRITHNKPEQADHYLADDLSLSGFSKRTRALIVERDSADDICFYTQPNQSGSRYCYDASGDWSSQAQGDFAALNNRLRSVSIGAGLRVALFAQNNQRGEWVWLDAGDHNLNAQTLDTRVKSMAVLVDKQAQKQSANWELTLTGGKHFDQRQFVAVIRGQYGKDKAKLEITEIGKGEREPSQRIELSFTKQGVLALPDLAKWGLDNRIVSISGLPNHLIDVYEKANFSGHNTSIMGNQNDLSAMPLGEGISSIRIARLQKPDALSCFYQNAQQQGLAYCTDQTTKRATAFAALNPTADELCLVGLAEPDSRLDRWQSSNILVKSGQPINYQVRESSGFATITVRSIDNRRKDDLPPIGAKVRLALTNKSKGGVVYKGKASQYFADGYFDSIHSLYKRKRLQLTQPVPWFVWIAAVDTNNNQRFDKGVDQYLGPIDLLDSQSLPKPDRAGKLMFAYVDNPSSSDFYRDNLNKANLLTRLACGKNQVRLSAIGLNDKARQVSVLANSQADKKGMLFIQSQSDKANSRATFCAADPDRFGDRICTLSAFSSGADIIRVTTTDADFNRQVSSLNIAPNHQVQLHIDDNRINSARYRGSVSFVDAQGLTTGTGINNRSIAYELNAEKDLSQQVCTYELPNRQGERRCFNSSQPKLSDDWNERISAIVVPNGKQVRLFTQPNYSGESLLLQAGDTVNLPAAFNNQVSSLLLVAADNLTQACFYTKPGFLGEMHCYKKDQSKLAAQAGKFQSALLPPEHSIKLYAKADYQGRSLTLRSDASDLNKLNFGKLAQSLKFTNEKPSDRLCFYEFANYQGEALCYSADQAKNIPTQWQKRFSSVYLPNGLKITLFAKANKQGESLTLNKSVRDLAGQQFDNTAMSFSSAKQDTPVTDDPRLCFYPYANQRGSAKCLDIPSAGRQWANTSKLFSEWADKPASLEVPNGFSVRLHSESDFDTATFHQDVQGHVNINQRIGSINVQPTDPTRTLCLYQKQNFNSAHLCQNLTTNRIYDLKGNWWAKRARALQLPVGYELQVLPDAAQAQAGGEVDNRLQHQMFQRLQNSQTALSVVGLDQTIQRYRLVAKVDTGVCLYTNQNQQGESFCYNAQGQPQQQAPSHLGSYRSRLRSLHISDGYRIALFPYANHQGRWQWLESGDYNLDQLPLPGQSLRTWAHRLGSIAILKRPASAGQSGQVGLFSDQAFNLKGGAEAMIRWDAPDQEANVRYKDAKGQYQTLKLTRDANNALNWNLPTTLKDKVSSLSAQTGVYVDVFYIADQVSMLSSFLGTQSALIKSADNEIQSIRIRNVQQPDRTSCVYASANFSGKSFCFDQDQADLSTNDQRTYRDLLSNTSDWQLAPNVNLTLYSQPNYQGRSLILNGSVTRLQVEDALDHSIGSVRFSTRESHPDQACFYKYSQQIGQAICYGNSQAQLPNGLDNRIQSLNVPEGYRLKLYQYRNYQGATLELNAGEHELSNTDFAQRISSVELLKDTQLQACLYPQSQYRGARHCLSADQAQLPSNLDLNSNSLVVAKGTEVELFDKPNFQGKSLTLRGDTHTLSHHGWYHRARSIRIRTHSLPKASVCLYQQPNFAGSEHCYSHAQQINYVGYDLDDRFQSAIVTSGISTRLYQYADQEGASLRLEAGRYSNLSKYGFAKQTSSLTLIAPQAPQVCLYPEPNYQGMPTCIQSNIGKLENSQADRNSLIGANSANLNNRIASIRIPDGLSIEVYDEENYAADLGQRATLQGNVPNLFGYRLHQRISSIRVYPQGSRPQQAPQARARSAKTKTTQLANAQSSKADSGDEDGDGGSDAGTNTALSWLIPSAHAEEDAPNTVHYEDQQYYYHTDHLNGTRYLTDKNGDVVETNLTFPGGETWVNQTIKRSADDYKTPYTFTGKEQDASGLYYYGARYYDPRAQVWASVDPILNEYLGNDPSKLRGMGGIFNSRNLGMYSYSFNNPTVLTDPNGEEPLTKQGLMEFFNAQNSTMSKSAMQAYVGQKFESAVRRSLNLTQGSYIPSSWRGSKTRGKASGFIPDGVGNLGFFPDNLMDFSKYGVMKDGVALEASLKYTEVKATSSNSIAKSYNNYQISSMIEHLSGEAEKDGNRVRPSLYVITTSGVNLGPSLIGFASRKGVDLLHGSVELSDTEPGKVRVQNMRHLNPSTDDTVLQPPNGKWVKLFE